MKRVLRGIDYISEWSGRVVSFLALLMIGVLVFEVISRYVFNAPTLWAHQLASHIFAVYGVLLGAYTLFLHGHVKVDIVHNIMSPRTKAIMDSITYLVFFLFVGVLFWWGLLQAIHSVQIMEGPTPPFVIPVWPIRLTVPLGAVLIFLQGLAEWIRRLSVAFRGREL